MTYNVLQLQSAGVSGQATGRIIEYLGQAARRIDDDQRFGRGLLPEEITKI
jgi:hypothetical protein